jgi:hypothetical protein
VHPAGARAQKVGVSPSYRSAVTDLRELGDADLIVGTEGVNSATGVH